MIFRNANKNQSNLRFLYMLFVSQVIKSKRINVESEGVEGLDLLNLKRSEIPAVIHVDYSAKIQTVNS